MADELFQMVTWQVLTPEQIQLSPPLFTAEAERLLANLRRDGRMDGSIRPYEPKYEPGIVNIPANIYRLRDAADRLSADERKFVLQKVKEYERNGILGRGDSLRVVDMAVPEA